MFPSIYSNLLLPFESMITHSHSCVVWTITLFFSRFLNWSIFSVHSLSGAVLLFLCTVTQGPCNVSLLFRSEMSTHSHYYSVWNTFSNTFSNIFYVEQSHSSGVTVTQGSRNIFYCFQVDFSLCRFLFGSLMNRFLNDII